MSLSQILSGLVNYAKYMQEKMDLHEEAISLQDQTRDALEEAERENRWGSLYF